MFSSTTTLALIPALISATLLAPHAAAYTAPKGTGSFQLQTIAYGGNLSYSGQWLSPYHTGAGSSVLVLTDDQSTAQNYTFNTTSGSVTAVLGSYPYSVSLTGEDIFTPPTHYAFVGFNIGSGGDFHFSTPENYLKFPEDRWGFAICQAQIYVAGTYEPTLVYRNLTAEMNATCGQVHVKAIF